jgi:preprotein translocase SecE subunit
LVECRSPKPKVAGSSPAVPAIVGLFLYIKWFPMFLRRWSSFALQVFTEAKRIDWFAKEDLLGSVLRILLIVAIVSTVFLGIDWVISSSIALLLKI